MEYEFDDDDVPPDIDPVAVELYDSHVDVPTRA